VSPAFDLRGNDVRKRRAALGFPAAAGDKDLPIALICAGGVRTAFAADLLRDRGFTQILDVGEGMLGSGDGPGWIARGLPTEPCPQCS
jgi:rhodanese-related sulfurtransferase